MYWLAIRAGVPIARRVESLDGGGLAGDGIGALDLGKPEQVVERAVFEHQHKDVFDAVRFGFVACHEPA